LSITISLLIFTEETSIITDIMSKIKIDLGKKIKEFRQLKGFTQESFAEALGISVTAMSKIETGMNFPSADTIEKITKALNVTSSELFTFKENLNTIDAYSQIILELDKIKNNPEKLNLILRIIKAAI